MRETSTIIFPVLLLVLVCCPRPSVCCREGNKALGVCLHVYLERDFLSLERIVYPSKGRLGYLSTVYQKLDEAKGIKSKLSLPLESIDEGNNNASKRNLDSMGVNPTIHDTSNVTYTPDLAGKNQPSDQGKHGVNTLRKRRRKRRSHGDDDYAESGNFGHRDWVEGPELEDHCRRLEKVVECFEEVLIDCDSGYDFFRYRHLLHALRYAHKYLCLTPQFRRDRFLGFLKTIECAETARTKEATCYRHNVSNNVWNQILRAEIGEEICHSLNTQRSCLLQHKYVLHHCRDDQNIVDIYTNLSSLFLSIWCKLPVHPKLYGIEINAGFRGINSITSQLLMFGILYLMLV